jgi:hypothetical protein
LMRRITLAQPLLFSGINGLNPHLAHEPTDMVATDGSLMILCELDSHPTGTVERAIRVDAVNESLDTFIIRIQDRVV